MPSPPDNLIGDPMDISQIGSKTAKLIADNAPMILTGLGVAGTVATAYLSATATYKGTLFLMEELKRELQQDEKRELVLTRKDRFKLTWKFYIPAAGVGSLTITSIIMANRISMKRTAALAGALALADRAHTEYKDKVEQHFGKNKEQKVRDDVAQDHVNANPVGKQQVFITGGGEVLCMDLYSGRYFMSSVESLRRAENLINKSVLTHDSASLTDFYSHIGLPSTKVSDEVGWNSMGSLLELSFSTTISDDERPCIAVDFDTAPLRDYYAMR